PGEARERPAGPGVHPHRPRRRLPLPEQVTRVFRSVGARLSMALVLVVAVALGIVYLTVVPSLQSRLERTRLVQLEGAARRIAPVAAKSPVLQQFANTESQDVGARVMVYEPLGG